MTSPASSQRPGADLEDGSGQVRPIEHRAEAGPVVHVALHGREEDLRRVAEDDHAERDGERPDVDAQLDGAPVPVGEPREAVEDDDGVDDHVRDRAPEAEPGDVAQTAQQRARQKHAAADEDPRGEADRDVEFHATPLGEDQVCANHAQMLISRETTSVLRPEL